MTITVSDYQRPVHLVPDSGIDSQHDLVAILPPEVAARVDEEMLAEPYTAAALRVLATIKNPGWHDFVGAVRIDWPNLMFWAEAQRGAIEARVRIAALLADRAVSYLDRENTLAVMDAVRIAWLGLPE